MSSRILSSEGERVELFNIEICLINLCFYRHRGCLCNQDEISLQQRDEVRRAQYVVDAREEINRPDDDFIF